jgi:hypothetical protein
MTVQPIVSMKKGIAVTEYKDLYEVAKDVLEEEGAREARLDEKASRMLSALTIVIGVYAFSGQWILQHMPPNGVLEILMLVFAAFGFFFLAWAWVRTFSVFKMSSHAKIPFNQRTLDQYQRFDKEPFFFSMTKTIQDSIDHNRKVGDKKAQALSDAYRLISPLTSACLLLLLLTIVAHTWITAPEQNVKPSNSNVSTKTK